MVGNTQIGDRDIVNDSWKVEEYLESWSHTHVRYIQDVSQSFGLSYWDNNWAQCLHKDAPNVDSLFLYILVKKIVSL